MFIFKAKISANLPLKQFLLGIFTSKAESYMAIDSIKFFSLTGLIFPHFFGSDQFRMNITLRIWIVLYTQSCY